MSGNFFNLWGKQELEVKLYELNFLSEAKASKYSTKNQLPLLLQKCRNLEIAINPSEVWTNVLCKGRSKLRFLTNNEI
jgi:hypothetical protein